MRAISLMQHLGRALPALQSNGVQFPKMQRLSLHHPPATDPQTLEGEVGKGVSPEKGSVPLIRTSLPSSLAQTLRLITSGHHVHVCGRLQICSLAGLTPLCTLQRQAGRLPHYTISTIQTGSKAASNESSGRTP